MGARRIGRALSCSQKKALEEGLKNWIFDPKNILDGKIFLEIGFGQGENLVHQAHLHPDHSFIGVEFFINGLATFFKKYLAAGLKNVWIYPGDIHMVLKDLPMLDQVYILFPDPWSKKRHHKRRLIQPNFLEILASRMNTGAKLILSTDHVGYFEHMKETSQKMSSQFMWLNPENSYTPPDDWISTRYALKSLSPPQFIFLEKLKN